MDSVKSNEELSSCEIPEEIEVPRKNYPTDHRKNKSCRQFTREGKCRFSEKCIYDHSQVKVSKKTAEPSVCRFYKRSGTCRFGTKCKFLHDTKVVQNERDLVSQENQKFEKYVFTNNCDRVAPVCRYFKRSQSCREGENCQFNHCSDRLISTRLTNVSNSILKMENLSTGESEPAAVNVQKHERKVVINPLNAKLRLCDLTDDCLNSLCETEIAQLKKRFPRYVEITEKQFRITLSASDPDWPFDVKCLDLLITFPVDYPREVCGVMCCDEMKGLPLILFRYLNKSMELWLKEQHETNAREGNCQLLLRPFLRWIDRNLQELFITGLKMAKRDMEAQSQGITFVPYEDVQTSLLEDTCDSLCTDGVHQVGKENFATSRTNEDVTYATEEFEALKIEPKLGIASTTKKIGTEIKLCNLELMESAATLSCQKLSLLLQCGRCKLKSDITLIPHKTNRVICSKCRHEQKITFRPQLLHQFMAVLGYLDLLDCHIVDVLLLKCQFAIGCLSCSRQMTADGLQFGQRRTTWCLFCNKKMQISMQSVKFNKLQVANVTGQGSGSTQLMQLGKMKKKVNDPAIQEGSELPDKGTCKHYKKSYRWLRFPCCGKAYPCDICHEEKETDHEMKLATRMICGYCAKEQAYATGKECITCGSNMTKKAGGHWQGGKGCRDSTKMNRLDRQKYTGTNKTVSNKTVSNNSRK